MISVVVPTCRPEMAQNIAENFARQRYIHKELIIVQNGPAVGSPVEGATVLHSKPGVSHARNAGLEWLIDRGRLFFAFMDDDDYYGPGYLDEVAVSFVHEVHLVGKPSAFVELDGELYRTAPESGITGVHGPTLAGRVSPGMPRFPVQSYGEDGAFCDEYLRRGLRIAHTSSLHFCYRRSSHRAHTYPATREEMLHSMCIDGPVERLGAFDARVIDGEAEAKALEVLPREEPDFDRLTQFRAPPTAV